MTSKILPARHVHFAPDQNSGSHRPPAAFRKMEREPLEEGPEPIDEVLHPSAPTHIVTFPKPIPPLTASLELATQADACFRKKMAAALIQGHVQEVTDLVTAHKRFYTQLYEAEITRKLDCPVWYAVFKEINKSVDHAFADALRKISASAPK